MQPMLLFGTFGTQEIVLILLVILLLFGARKLPELARALGRSLNEFRKGREEGTDSTETKGSPPAKENGPKQGPDSAA